jgi:maltooligosyltrehalose trehalohydrolase
MQALLADPADPATFRRCQLDLSERQHHAAAYALHVDLLHLRRDDPALGAGRSAVDGAVLGPAALALRFFAEAGDDRLLLVNLGTDLEVRAMPEPLVAPPPGRPWTLAWSSEDPRYGGGGYRPEDTPEVWRLPGPAAFVLAPGPAGARRHG